MGAVTEVIPLQWLKNDLASAQRVFNQEGGHSSTKSPSGWFVGATPLTSDFPLSHETLAPFVDQVLHAMAVVESHQGFAVGLVEIRRGVVRVF